MKNLILFKRKLVNTIFFLIFCILYNFNTILAQGKNPFKNAEEKGNELLSWILGGLAITIISLSSAYLAYKWMVTSEFDKRRALGIFGGAVLLASVPAISAWVINR